MWVEETSYDPMIRHTCGSAIFMLYSHSSMRGLAGWVMLKKINLRIFPSQTKIDTGVIFHYAVSMLKFVTANLFIRSR